MAWHWKPRIATHDSVLFLPRLLSTHACVLQPLPQNFSARNLGALKGPGIGYLKKTPQCSSVPGRFPFNKNFGLKFRKFHVPYGTVHSGFTDLFQATACLLIVPSASRIQKSGTGDNNFVKWKGLSGRTDWNEWTGQSEPPSKVVPNISVGPHRNGSFHLISYQNLRIFGLNGKRPRKIGCNKFMMYEMWHQRSCVTVEVERSYWPRDLMPTRTYDLS